MGLLDRIAATRHAREWPVGAGEVDLSAREFGHDDERFSPESYGDFIVTSNEIFSVVSLRARRLSEVPLRLYSGEGADRQLVERGDPAVDLLRTVNPFWTWKRLSRMDELSMSLWGETFWAVERDNNGVPTEVWWLKPSRVKPVPHPDGYLSGYLYEPSKGSERIPFGTDEIVWQRYPNPIDEFSALSPVAAARLAAQVASSMLKSNDRLFRHGMQLGGLIVPRGDKVTFSQEQAEDLERIFTRRFSGADKAHRWAVLRYEAELKQMEVTNKDAEFIQGLNLTLRQVARVYGVPPALLGDLEFATLANLKELDRALFDHALIPDAGLRSSEIEEQFLPMFGTRTAADNAEYDFSGVTSLQEAESEVWARDRQALEAGAMTINEWRTRQGMPDVPWGNGWWAPVNKALVTDAASMPADLIDGTVGSSNNAEDPEPDDDEDRGLSEYDQRFDQVLDAIHVLQGSKRVQTVERDPDTHAVTRVLEEVVANGRRR